MNTILTGLFYNGALIHILINYLMLFITIIPFLLSNLKNENWKRIFLIAVIIQVSFWFLLNAFGISIIWNTMLGVLLFSLFKKKFQSKIYYFAVGSAILADTYYAISFPIITTIAHISSILLGLVLAIVFRKK